MKKIKYLALGIIFSGMLHSCLKDTPFLDVSNTQPIIEFVGTSGFGPTLTPSSQSYSITPPLVDEDTSIALNIASPQVLDHDVTVTVKLDSVLIDSLDNQQGLSYEKLPDSMFTVSSYTVKIPAGYRIGRLKMHLKLSEYDYINHSYAIGFTIVSAPGLIVSGNATSFVWTFDVRNKYDGYYSLRFQLKNWAAYGIVDGGGSNPWPNNIGFETTGPNSNVINTESAYGYLQPAFTSALAITGFGATQPQFTFDPVTNNLISVTNLVPDDGRGRKFKLNPAVTDSRYDSVHQVIYAAYIMSQNGRPDQEIYDTLVYQKPR